DRTRIDHSFHGLGAVIHRLLVSRMDVGGRWHTGCMTFFEVMHDAMGRLAVFEELDVEASALPGSASGLSDESVRDALAEVAKLAQQVDILKAVLAGVAASRSGRDTGHGGL